METHISKITTEQADEFGRTKTLDDLAGDVGRLLSFAKRKEGTAGAARKSYFHAMILAGRIAIQVRLRIQPDWNPAYSPHNQHSKKAAPPEWKNWVTWAGNHKTIKNCMTLAKKAAIDGEEVAAEKARDDNAKGKRKYQTKILAQQAAFKAQQAAIAGQVNGPDNVVDLNLVLTRKAEATTKAAIRNLLSPFRQADAARLLQELLDEYRSEANAEAEKV